MENQSPEFSQILPPSGILSWGSKENPGWWPWVGREGLSSMTHCPQTHDFSNEGTPCQVSKKEVKTSRITTAEGERGHRQEGPAKSQHFAGNLPQRKPLSVPRFAQMCVGEPRTKAARNRAMRAPRPPEACTAHAAEEGTGHPRQLGSDPDSRGALPSSSPPS